MDSWYNVETQAFLLKADLFSAFQAQGSLKGQKALNNLQTNPVSETMLDIVENMMMNKKWFTTLKVSQAILGDR